MDQRGAPRPSTPGATIDAGAVQMTGTPSITSVDPVNGSFTGGTTVTISGTGFTGATTVNFGTISAAHFTVDSDISITVTGPATASIGKVDIVVNSAQGSSSLLGTSTVDQFTYLATTPTISFAVPNHVYGDAPFTVSASSESTGAITYLVVSGPATVSGSTVTLTGVGTTVQSASQAASGNFAAATASTSFAVDADPPLTELCTDRVENVGQSAIHNQCHFCFQRGGDICSGQRSCDDLGLNSNADRSGYGGAECQPGPPAETTLLRLHPPALR